MKYLVSIPIAGSIHFEIEAESKTEAEEKAWEMDPDDGEVEWEMHRVICAGNVLHVAQNEVEVSRLKP